MKSTAFIRRATAADVDLLAEIGRQTFVEAFGAANTPENMATFLRAHFTPETVAVELAAPDHEFYLAAVAGESVGYLKLRWPALDARVPYRDVLQISRLYLLEKFLGQGLGDQLMQFSLARAHQHHCAAVWLTVWEHNPRAISFYQKWGFRQTATEDFILGGDVQLDYVLVKAL